MSIDRWIVRHAAFTPDKPALRFSGGDLSYAALAEAVGRAAWMLRKRYDVGHGDRLAYLGTNAPDLLILLFAAARLGAIVLPLNWRLAPPELAHAMEDSGAKLLVHQPGYAEVAEAIAGTATRFASDPEHGGLAAMLGGAPGLDDGPGAASDPVLLVYTSGTTGRPKGAVLTQAALEANALNARHMHDMSADDLVLTVLPMFHVGGLNIQTTPALYVGATVLLHDRFHPGTTLSAIAAERPTLTVLVPATLAALIGHPQFRTTDLSSLRAIATGSSDVPIPLMAAFGDRGVPVIQIYGSTETAPVAIYQRVGDDPAELGAMGRPGLHSEARIIRRDGTPAATGEVGEIEVRGPHVTTGYWNRPEATAESLCDGWFRTGDLGLCDERGVYWFKDRLKNVVISGGENIYPAELERVLRELPGVNEAVVVGRPDPRWGEVPVAVVVPQPGAERDPQAVLHGFEGKLARYKHPKAVVFVEELPRNALGKIRVDLVKNLVSSGSRIE